MDPIRLYKTPYQQRKEALRKTIKRWRRSWASFNAVEKTIAGIFTLGMIFLLSLLVFVALS